MATQPTTPPQSPTAPPSAPQGDIFDQLASGNNSPQAQPNPSSMPSAAPPQSAQGQGDIFDQLANGSVTSDTANQPTQPSQPTGFPQGVVSAVPGSMPGDSLPSKITLWAQQLRNDLMHGTENTDIGRLYKSIGGQPLAAEQGEKVGEFMGSPILGPLRMVQGASELPQSGLRWAGVKDTVGGALDAAQIPGGFIGTPEAGPLAGKLAGDGGEAILTQAARAASGAKGFFSVKSLQPKLPD